MKQDMIVKIEKYLDKLQQKPVTIQQDGFLINQFFMEKMMYKIQNDTLNLRDEMKEVYISLNLNQVYQVEIGENKMILFLDNDTRIQLN
jgi:muramoyltetrapeptide carboxypeptidase LdcA involved in peptidoglycan recycling